MITIIYKLSQRFFNRSAYHGRRGNTLRMWGNYYISQGLLEAKTFIQSL
jgi:hypothetical protein